jgi:integrase
MRMRKWCDEAGLSECSPHGLRKAAARRLAEAGASVHQIAAITGHRSLKEVARYTQRADQIRLAREAIQLIGPENKKSDAGGKPS